MKKIGRLLVILFVVVTVMGIVRTTIITFIRIPGNGEQPVFQAGDRVALLRTAYGIRLTPMSKLGYVRWGTRQARRGDWIAFNNPTTGDADTTPVDRRELFVGYCYAAPGDSLWIDSVPIYKKKNGTIGLKFNVHRKKPVGINRYKVVQLPRKNAYVDITPDNIHWYAHMINLHEGEQATITGDSLFVGGRYMPNFRFIHDYYWISSADSRNKADSRSFGFVPDTYLIGRISRIVYSIDPEAPWYTSLRAGRTMKKIPHIDTPD